jgi:hypothetical protein
MKFLQLCQITVDLENIFAVEWDRLAEDGLTRTTLIKPKIPGLAAVQLYSSFSNYEEDKVQLMMALNKQSNFSTQVDVFTEEQETPLKFLHLSVRIINICHRAGIYSAEKLAKFKDHELLEINSIGMQAVKEIREKLDIWRNSI